MVPVALTSLPAPAAGAEGGRPDGPRASDADRDRFAAELHEHFAEGRLSLEELQRRLDLVFRGRRRSSTSTS